MSIQQPGGPAVTPEPPSGTNPVQPEAQGETGELAPPEHLPVVPDDGTAQREGARGAYAPYQQTPDGKPPTQGGYAPPPHYPQYPGGPYPPYYGAPHPARRSNVGWIIAAIVGIVLLLGIVVIVAIAVAAGLFISTASSREVSRSYEQTFAVTSTPSLVVDASAGAITVRQGAGNEVQVQVTRIVRAVSTSVGENAVGQIPATVTQSGNTVTVTSHFNASMFDGTSMTRRVEIVATVPSTTHLDLRLAAGNITVTDITGNVRVNANAGNITLTNATLSGTSSLTANAGSIRLDGTLANGSTLNANVNTGNIALTLPQTLAAHLQADANVGNVTINGWPISTTREGVRASASGDLNAPATSTITAHAAVGNVTVSAK